jgi:hypothetical protein
MEPLALGAEGFAQWQSHYISKIPVLIHDLKT